MCSIIVILISQLEKSSQQDDEKPTPFNNNLYEAITDFLEEQKQAKKESLELFDTNKDGFLGVEELIVAAEAGKLFETFSGYKFNGYDVQEKLDQWDFDNDNKLSFEEWVNF